MHYNKLIRKQIIPVGIQEAWEFFSNPANLAEITPDKMDFKITSDLPESMYEGAIITYVVKPLLGIPMKWMTEITKIEEPNLFIDCQLVGPYKVWHHQHHFKDLGDQTEMTDIVNYSVSPWPLGNIADKLFVHKQLQAIFDYRTEKIEELFNQQSQKNSKDQERSSLKMTV